MSKLLAICAALAILSVGVAGRAAQLPGPQDYLEADSATYESGGTWKLSGNILLHLESLFPDTPLELRAEEMLYNEAVQEVRVPGAISISLTAYSFEVSGKDLTLNLQEAHGELSQVEAEMTFDPSLLADETGLIDRQFVRYSPDRDPKLLLVGAKLTLKRESDGHPLLGFDHARLATSASEKPDLIIRVQSLLFSPGRFTSFRNLRVSASGITLFYAPRWKQRYRKGVGIINGTVPIPGRDSEDGWYLQQATFADYGDFHADVYSRYFFDHGVWSEGFFFVDPTANSRVGVTVGRSRSKDFYENSVGRGTYYDISWRQRAYPKGFAIGELEFGVNYGRLKQDIPRIISKRGYGFIAVTSPPVKLGKNLHLIGSTGAHYWDYEYHDKEFLAFKHRVKLARATPVGLDYVQFMHADKFGFSPFRFEDNFPENELSFQKNFQAFPSIALRMSGRYNYDRERFDNLTAGVSREFRSYWAGLAYDFARGTTSIEAAVKF